MGSRGTDSDNGGYQMGRRTDLDGYHEHTASGWTNMVGQGVPFDIRPEYYTVAYIMFTGI